MRQFTVLLLAGASLVAGGASPAAAQATPIPPVRLIAAPTAKSPAEFGVITGVIALPDGKLLINDQQQRRLVLLDSTLTSSANVMDTVSGAANSYPRIGGLLPYAADSSLFVDATDFSMLVLDPTGKIARVAAVPRPRDAVFLAVRQLGSPGVDAKHHLVYAEQALPKPPAPDAKSFVPSFPDTAFIVTADLATRTIDTVGTFKVAAPKVNVNQSNGNVSITTEINPLPVTDGWAVTSDGSIAIVHAQDVHIDWINADGTRSSTPKIPFEWRRLTDDDKAAVIDSTKAALDKARATQQLAGGGRGQVMITMRGGGGGGGDAPPPTAITNVSLPQPTIISAADLPDYRPPFPADGVKADLDDNLWIRTSQIRPNAPVPGTIYDVVNRKGELVDRVEVPAGRVIVAFGHNGIVYMAARDEHGSWIERTHR